jgi:methionine-rich copper-binding protein CopC
MRRGVVLLAVAVLAVAQFAVAGAAPASAHAGVDHTAPRNGSVLAVAPSTVTVTFDEPVDVDSAWLTGPSGARLPSTARTAGASIVITPSTPLPRGPIAASWKVTSDDGHTVTGSIAFIIGKAPATGPAQALALTPALPARLSGSSPGPLTLTFGTALSAGEVSWTTATMSEPMTWSVSRKGRSSVATGVLPLAGVWTMKASLVRADNSIVVTTGTVTLK